MKRGIVINAPRQEVYDFLRFLKNQEKFNKWAKTDPNRKVETQGTDGTEGYIYSWSGNKDAGEGAKEIISLKEGSRIETEIRFIRPMKVSARVIMELESSSDNSTMVNWINCGTLSYPWNLLIPIAEKNFGKDMEESLRSLKDILEGENG